MPDAPRGPDFSDSDLVWAGRLRRGPHAAPESAAEREADALRRALELESQRIDNDPLVQMATTDEAMARRVQQLQFRLRREKPARRWWQRPGSWASGLAASALLAVLVATQYPADTPIYDEPPRLRGGESEVVRVSSAKPRSDAEALAEQLKLTGQPVALHQLGKVFSVDVPLAADTPPNALAIVRRTGARAVVGGTTRVEFAPAVR